MRNFGGLLILMLALFTIPAQAADLTIFGGLQHPGKITLGSALSGTGDFIINPGNFGVYGARVGLGLSKVPFIGQEHTIAVASNFIDTHSKAVIYNANLRLQAPLPFVKPYATIGAGVIHLSGSDTEFGTKFAINYGGGVKVTLLGPVGARIDVRDYTVPKVQGQTLNVLEVSAGVVFSF